MELLRDVLREAFEARGVPRVKRSWTFLLRTFGSDVVGHTPVACVPASGDGQRPQSRVKHATTRGKSYLLCDTHHVP